MQIDEARRTKHELGEYVRELASARAQPVSDAAPTVAIALGLAPRAAGGFDVAVRYPLGTPTARMVARRLVEQAGPDLDVRRTGRIHPLGRVGPRPPVTRARASGETGRVRPLRPGVSIAHYTVTAGTLGGFVSIEGDRSAYALSNFHVLAASPRTLAGDEVLQPAPADGGRLPQDRVGELAAFVPLEPGGTALVDAAIARLDDPEVEPTYPVGSLAGWCPVAGAEQVQKAGRTTGVTDGRVSAIELDGVVVDYGPELGLLTFHNQVEVEGTGTVAFSRGGDSGSVVYRPDTRQAVGLLFAGSDTGGDNGLGLTYLNPIGEVLTAVQATLR